MEAVAGGRRTFSGRPDFSKLHHYPKPTLTSEEQAFIDNELETLLAMLDDHKIVKEDRDLPKGVWDFLCKERFFFDYFQRILWP